MVGFGDLRVAGGRTIRDYSAFSLSPHFTLAELTKTGKGENIVDNEDIIIPKLRNLCLNILEPVRANFGRPVTVNSGYRSPLINSKVGGSSTSQHMLGEAADFEIAGIDNRDIAQWISENLEYDQLILEFYVVGKPSSGWVHCSYVTHRKNRKEKKITKTVNSADGKSKTNFPLVSTFF